MLTHTKKRREKKRKERKRENIVAGKSEEKHAIGWKKRGEKHACNGSEEERQDWGRLCPPIPFTGDKSR